MMVSVEHIGACVFLNRLSQSQRVAFLSLAHDIVTSDTVTTVGEVTRLTEIRGELGFARNENPELLRTETAAERFASLSARTIAMIELIDLCYADRRLSILESGLITRLATMWSFDGNALRQFEDWVHRHRKLMSEGQDLIARSL